MILFICTAISQSMGVTYTVKSDNLDIARQEAMIECSTHEDQHDIDTCVELDCEKSLF